MTGALLRGPSAVGRGAIQATRITRQTVRGKDGGVYHVLAPGPSILLAPLLRVDRALNLRLGTPGRLTVSLLAWNALAGLLIGALFLLLRDATGSPGLSAAGRGRRRARAAVRLLLVPVLPGDAGRARADGRVPRGSCSCRGSRSAPPGRWAWASPRCPGCTRSSCPYGPCWRCGRSCGW